jgi:beta-lactamase regulating signal transducer with metallopeptidase domain
MHVTGWTLAHFVWQGGLIALMVAATLRLGRRWPSNARYVVACGGLVAMLVVPIATALVLSSTSPRPLMNAAMEAPALTPRSLVDAAGEAPVLTPRLAPEPTRSRLSVVSIGETIGGMLRNRANGWLPPVVWSWCAGVLFLLARMAVRLREVRRLRRTWRSAAPPPLRTVCHEMASRLGLRVPFRVVESAAVDSPTVIGWVRPVILLPIAALSALSPAQVEAILAHELAHVRRHDYVVNLLQTVVETLLFYHPAVWWLSGRVRAEREHACDDIALAVCDDRVEYAAALAELEARRGRDCAPALAATQGSLAARVRRILRVPVDDAPRSPGWVATMLLGVVFTTGAVGMVDLPSLGRSGAVTAISAVEPQQPPVRVQASSSGLRRAPRQPVGDRSGRLARQIEDTQQRAAELAEQEAEISAQIAGLGSLPDQDRSESIRRLMTRKDEMEAAVADLEQELDTTAAEFRRDEPDSSNSLQGAADGIRESKLKEMIRYSRGLVRARSSEYALQFEEEIGDHIADLRRHLAAAAEAVGTSQGTALEHAPPVATEQSSTEVRHAVVINFSLPSGHRPQIRGWDGEPMRIWLRAAGRLGFVPTIRDDSHEVVTVAVYDLDSVPERLLDQIELDVGGAPITFQTAVPFEIAVSRIVTTDFAALRREQVREREEQAARLAPIWVQFDRIERAVRLPQLTASADRATAVLKELEQAVASISEQVGANETTVELTEKLSELEELLQRLTPDS